MLLIVLALQAVATIDNGAKQAGAAVVSIMLKTDLEQRHSQAILRLNGETLLAMDAVLHYRRRDGALIPAERDPKNFLITVLRKDPLLKADEEGEALVVVFSPRYAPGEKEKLHGPTQLGRRLYYIVSLKDFAILRTGDVLEQMHRP